MSLLKEGMGILQYVQTLGAGGVLPGRQIESLLRVLNNLLTLYPLGKLKTCSQFAHHFDLDGISG